MASLQNPSSAPNNTPDNNSYDVFLSFRGIDTRFDFTSNLYRALIRTGTQTFMDDPELRPGDVISDSLRAAIENSEIYIVIFSENYASSGWCLDELVHMLRCSKSEVKKLIFPIFVHITATVVRYQTKTFNEAFKTHQTRLGDVPKLKEWRDTLTEVANISGYRVTRDRTQGAIIDEAVAKVLLRINPMALKVAKYPVGIDSRVDEITPLLTSDTESTGVTVIGIYGMGGVGKTTLAKAVFNKNVRNFEAGCFLADIREVTAAPKGLVSLQQQLILDILKSQNITVNNVDHGIRLMARIHLTKVLIVLDDLDNLKPLEFLVGPLGLGSVIIITTRDEDILDTLQVESRYRHKVNELNNADSLQLFKQHAFGYNEMSEAFTELSHEILHHVGGLPLALKVSGSNLLNQPEIRWRWFISKLQQFPNDDVHEKLMVSFDALKLIDPLLQDIFLDIACYFIGWKKDKVVKILETYYSFADHSIDILKKRCLVTINDENELSIHDLLRQIGWKIARTKSHHEPGEHSRLWVEKDIVDVLENNEGTEAIECIIPYNRSYSGKFERVSLATEIFKRMRRLRFLYLEDLYLTGSFQRIFKDLRWLHWSNCPLTTLPSDFCPHKLVTLELPHSNIQIWELTKVLDKLTTLDFSHSYQLSTTPDFTLLPNLQTLILESCVSLTDVTSIGSLVRLVSLNMSNCKRVKRLPKSICNFTALKSINLLKCDGLEALPLELLNIESLTEFLACELDFKSIENNNTMAGLRSFFHLLKAGSS